MSAASDRDLQKSRNVRSSLLCAVCIAVNVLGSYCASRLGSSLYFDSVGTILAAALGGIVPGVVTGFLTNCLKGLWDMSSVYYIPINILLAYVTAFFSRRGGFRRLPRVLLTLLCLALVGGGIGSVLTWYLNGSVYTGSVFAEQLLGQGAPPFLAQLVSDFLLDLEDKFFSLLIVLAVLRLLPDSVEQFRDSRVTLMGEKDTVRRLSLRAEIMLLFAGLMLIVSIAVTGITISLFNSSIVAENANMASGVARIAAGSFDPDRVPEYLALGEAAEGYAQSRAQLARIVESSEDIHYVYVYQIREDGCHVVFDPDTAAGPGSAPGELIEFDEAFLSVVPTLLEGGTIEPIISNEKYGWLLTVYQPVFDSQGRCQCYVGVDISMPRLRATERVFQVEMISLFLGFSMLITALCIWLADRRVIRPINDMAAATSAFARRKEDAHREGLALIEALDIRTGDEIENLYHAIASTSREVVENISDIQAKTEQITRLQGGLIMVLADMVESRDKCTGNHVRNTADYVRLILKKLREDGKYPELLTDDYINEVVRSAPLHDVGKIKVPDALLNKPGKLTDEEFALMKQHTIYGGEIIDSAIEQVAGESSLFLNEARKLTLCHHERWDGKGYPYGLKGEEIPLSARVMAVADVFDALVSKRSYKEGFPVDKAISIIREESGTHFDPEVVTAFLAREPEARAIAETSFARNEREYESDEGFPQPRRYP